MKKIISGFTLVELLIVIAVIGILATVGVMSFDSVQANARNSQRTSDVKIIAEALEKYYTKNGEYPSCSGVLDASPSTVASTLTLDKAVLTAPTAASDTNSLTCSDLNSSSPDSFGYVVNGNHWTLKYREEGTGNIISVSSSRNMVACPSGFIVVPGSTTYGTSSFCVMKYEAKNVSGVATSQVTLTPWATITQTDALSTAALACSGCHLITEAEWMTIAQNVLSVASNWSNGTVGSGYMPRGNSNSSAATDATSDLTGVNKRTLTLSNGEVIWDLAGNVQEWTSGTAQSPIVQPGVTSAGYAWREWTVININNLGTLPISITPASTRITGSSTWNSSNGIGVVYSSTEETALHGFFRGGAWDDGSYCGILEILMNYSPGSVDANIGFRVTR